MDQELIAYTENLLHIADLRNLSRTTPVQFKIELGPEHIIIQVGFVEPDYRGLPFNLIWVVADQASPDYGKILRRETKVATGPYKSEWIELQTVADITSQSQYYDLSDDNTFLLGEFDDIQVMPATQSRLGVVLLNIAPSDSSDPVVTASNDVRMSDAREPLEHNHPAEPFTHVVGQLDGASVITLSGPGPTANQVLMITGINNGDPNDLICQWRTVTAADIDYVGIVPVSLVIIGSNTINETETENYIAEVTFSDSSVQQVAASWSLISGSSHATINQQGQVLANSVTENQSIVIHASFLHVQSGVTRQGTLEVTVIDTDVAVELDFITITGPSSVDEGSVAAYTVTATYSDLSTANVLGMTDFFTSSNGLAGTLNANTGQFTASLVSEDQSTTLQAQYTENGVTEFAELSIQVVDTTLYPVSVAIQGFSEMDEETTQTFTALVTYTDNSQQVQAATWQNANPSVGTMNTQTGEYTAQSLNEDLNDTISVSYTEEGITVTDTFDLLVKDVPFTFDSMTINGGTAIDEQETEQYSVTGYYSDGTNADLTSNTNWSIISGNTFASISTGGLLTANSVSQNETVTIQAQTTDPITLTELTETLVVTIAVSIPLPMYGIGPSNQNMDSSFINAYFTSTMVDDQSGNIIHVSPGSGEYGWFMAPVSYGDTLFTDNSNGFQGGWGGATWDGDNPDFESFGPQVISYLGISWNVYRHDFSNTEPAGGAGWTINYTG